jgi:hypothetical protein
MGRRILKPFIGYLDKAAQRLPECREASNGLKYTLPDGLKSALAVFYFQHPSLLNFQQAMRPLDSGARKRYPHHELQWSLYLPGT